MRKVLALFSVFCLTTFLMTVTPDVQAQSWGVPGNASGNMTQAPMSEWLNKNPGRDTASDLVCNVIGDLGGTQLFGCSPGSADRPLGKLLKKFCLAVSSIAVLFMIWEVFSSTIASANDGQFLGKPGQSHECRCRKPKK